MNRRDFIKKTSIGGAGLLVFPSITFGQNKEVDFDVYDFVTEGSFEYGGFHTQEFCDEGKCILSEGYVIVNSDLAYRRIIQGPRGFPVSVLKGKLEINRRIIKNGSIENILPNKLYYTGDVALFSASGLDSSFKSINSPFGKVNVGEEVSVLRDRAHIYNGRIISEEPRSFDVYFAEVPKEEVPLFLNNNLFFGPNKLSGVPILNSNKRLVGVCSSFYTTGDKLCGVATKIDSFFERVL